MDQNIGTMITQILPLLLLITVIIFITIMPQRKREKQVKQMLEEMKKGDWVRTIGGVVGRVYAVKGENVILETGPDKVKVTFTRVRLLRSATLRLRQTAWLSPILKWRQRTAKK
ncbi:MAG: preprotein translocase subunit YajC [Christensenellales bacterium]